MVEGNIVQKQEETKFYFLKCTFNVFIYSCKAFRNFCFVVNKIYEISKKVEIK